MVTMTAKHCLSLRAVNATIKWCYLYMAHLARGKDMLSICRTRNYPIALIWWQSIDLALGNRTMATFLPSDNKPPCSCAYRR